MRDQAVSDIPVWDLSDLYGGIEDPQITADFAEAGRLVAELQALQGSLKAAGADASALGAALHRAVGLYEAASNRLGAIGAYAQLLAAVDRSDAVRARFLSDVQARIAAIATPTLWLPLEINGIGDAQLDAALAVIPAAARWRPWLRRIRAERAHQLSPELEQLMSERSPAISQWVRLWDETVAGIRAKVGRESLTLSQALNRLSDPDTRRRRQAAGGLTAALQSSAPVLSLCLNTLAQEKQVEDRWRRYPTPAAPRHLANEADAEAVDAMVEAVVGACPRLSHRYYTLKARAMGKSRLDHWDRNAPLDRAPPRAYSWSEGREIVLQAFEALDPEMGRLAGEVFERPWIDARPAPAKQSGAFCHPVTAERHPYVFLNWMGERRDVLTLAHELGHAVHMRLSAPLGTLVSDTPLTLAETASIFAEGLVFDRLLAQADGAAARALVAGRIEDGLNTVVRQVAFHRFETRFHQARGSSEVGLESLGRIWLDVMGESLGPAVTLNPGYEVWWTCVSHFAHTPFYVYAYPFGDLLVAALMERRAADPHSFAPLYRALLAGGGSKTYVEALEPFGLDPRDPGFWRTGLSRLERLIDRFEQMI